MIISIKLDSIPMRTPKQFSLWVNGKWSCAGSAAVCLGNLRILLKLPVS